MSLPQDRTFDDPTNAAVWGPYQQLYPGARFGTGADDARLPREGRICKLPDGIGGKGVVFDSRDSSATVAACFPRLDASLSDAQVSAWMRFQRIQGEASSKQFNRCGVFARGDAAGIVGAESPDPYVALTNVDAYAFALEPQSQPGTFKWKLERWDAAGSVVDLAETAVMRQYQQTLHKPMGMRLQFSNDTGSAVTIKAQVKDTAYLEPVEAQDGGGPGNPGNSPLGVNSAFLKDYSTLAALYRANLMHGAREWVTQDIGVNDLVEKGHPKDLKANGLPNSIPTVATTLGTVLFRDVLTAGVDSTPLPTYRAGRYVVEWKGGLVELDTSGTYDVSQTFGVSTLPDGGRRLEFDVPTPSSAGIYLRITTVDAGGMDYLRVFYKDDEPTLATEPWDTDALKDFTEYFSCFRFMDFLEANRNEQETEADLLPDDYLFWSGDNGMPFFWQIELANKMQVNPWFNLPVKLNSAGRQAVLTQIRDGVDPGLEIYLERGNEQWLGQHFAVPVSGQPDAYFPGTSLVPGPFSFEFANDVSPHPTEAGAVQLGPGALDPNPYTAAYIGMGILAQQMFDDVNVVFQGQLDRVVRVAGSQFANAFVSEKVLENAPDADALAVAFYVPGTPGSTNYAPSIADIFTTLRSEFPTVRSRIQAQKAEADSKGVRLVAYEWGQQLICSPADLVKMMQVQADPLMEGFIEDLYQIWLEENGTELAVFFHSHQKGTTDGQYGFRRYPGQPQSECPKARALASIAEDQSNVGSSEAVALAVDAEASISKDVGFKGQKLVTPKVWKTVMEITVSGADYVAGGDAFGIFGDVAQTQAITGGLDKIWAAACSRLLVERNNDPSTIYFDDRFGGRVDSLCGRRTLDGLGSCFDYGSEFSGDLAGYGLALASNPYQLGYSSLEGGYVTASSNARGWEIYQRLADSPKSQHRLASVKITGGSSGAAVGLVQRVSVDTAAAGAEVPISGYQFLVVYNGTTAEAQLRRVNANGDEFTLATATGLGLSIGTAFTMELDVFDAFSTGEDGPVALIAKIDGSEPTWVIEAAVANQVQAYTDGNGDDGILDFGSFRLTSGPREGLFARPVPGSPSTVALLSYTQGVLQTGGGPPPSESVPSIAWEDATAGASGTLTVPVSFEVKYSDGLPLLQARMTSGRRRASAIQPVAPQRFAFAGVASQSEKDALETFFDEHGTQVPFSWDPTEIAEGFETGTYRLVRGSWRFERLRSRGAEAFYRVEFSLMEALTDGA